MLIYNNDLRRVKDTYPDSNLLESLQTHCNVCLALSNLCTIHKRKVKRSKGKEAREHLFQLEIVQTIVCE